MDETSLLALPEGMLIEQIQITEDGVIVEVLPPLPRRFARSVLKHPHRSIATIAGPYVMFPAQAVASSCS